VDVPGLSPDLSGVQLQLIVTIRCKQTDLTYLFTIQKVNPAVTRPDAVNLSETSSTFISMVTDGVTLDTASWWEAMGIFMKAEGGMK